MSNAPIALLYSLPVEILYRIFDSIDAQTIIFALRITCRRFKAIVDGYDRYSVDFQCMTKCNFQVFCRLIDPRKVISLTLSPIEETLNQIELFNSYFRVRQFNRLRSLTLININENQLKLILKRFQNTSITSFSFKLGRNDDRRKKTTAKILSSFIAKSNLHHLDLDVYSGRVENIVWPVQCMIRYLKIGSCNEFDKILTILRCSPHLQTMIVNFSDYVDETITQQNSSLTSFQQLTSLTLDNLRSNIDNIEFLLALVPSLTHLKLIGFRHFTDGSRWEQFIQTNLPFLSQFEVFLQKWTYADTSTDITSIISSFQTPFWLEHKKWFFTCEYSDIWPRFIKLYSIPICVPFLNYESESKKTSMSTFNPIINDNMSIMDNVKTLQLKSSNFTLHDVDQERQIPSNPMFRKVTKLELEYNYRLPNWPSFISTLVDLTKVTEIKLTGIMICQDDPDIIAGISNLLQQAHCLISLDIGCQYENRKWKLTAQTICSMTPPHVKHLAASVKNLNEVKLSLEQFQHLSTARFFYPTSDSFSDSFVEWLEKNRKGSSHFVGAVYTKIWFGHNNIQPKAVRVGNKRIKLIDEHHIS